MSIAHSTDWSDHGNLDEVSELAENAIMAIANRGATMTHYEVLRVRPDASIQTIDEAADRLAGNVGTLTGSPRFTQQQLAAAANRIALARTTLRDPAQRLHYDKKLAAELLPPDVKGTRERVAAATNNVLRPHAALPETTEVLSRFVHIPSRVKKIVGATAAFVALSIGALMMTGGSKESGKRTNDATVSAADTIPPATEPPRPVVAAPAAQPTLPSTDRSSAPSSAPIPPSPTPSTPPPTPAPRPIITPLPQPERVHSPTFTTAFESPPPTAEPTPPSAPVKQFNTEQYAIFRKKIADHLLEEKSDANRYDRAKLFLDKPEITSSPEAVKAVVASMFQTARTMKDCHRMEEAIEHAKNFGALSENEITACAKILLDVAVETGTYELAFRTSDELVASGTMNASAALGKNTEALKTYVHKNGPTLMKPEQEGLRQEVTRTFMKLAQDHMAENPDKALPLLQTAKATLGKQELTVRQSFDAEISTLVSDATQQKQLRQLAETLKTDPGNKEARSKRGLILLERGDLLGGVQDLAQSDHPLAALASTTTGLLAAGDNSSAQHCYVAGKEWANASKHATNGHKLAMKNLADVLFKQSITSTHEPLDPFSMATAREAIRTSGAAGNVDIASVPSASLQGKKDYPKKTEKKEPEWTSLMKHPDIKKHCDAQGRIVLDAPGKNKPTIFILPWKAPEGNKNFDVTFRVTIKRINGKNAFLMKIPAGDQGQGCTITLNGWPEEGGFTGISQVNGLRTGKKGILIKNEEPCVVTVHCQKQDGHSRLRVTLNDDETIIDWSGPSSSLSYSAGNELPRGLTAIGTVHDTTFVVEKIEVRGGATPPSASKSVSSPRAANR